MTLPILAVVLLIGACQAAPAATSGAPSSPTATSATPTAAVTTTAPTAAAPTTAPASLESLTGTWTFVPSNPRVIVATGGHAGGTVVIEGTHSIFTEGSYRSDWPIEISGTKALDCTATRCSIAGVALHELYNFGGQLAIVHKATGRPLGTFGVGCPDWVDVPDGGLVTVVSATVITFADGTAGGVGTGCEDGSHVVAWDTTATRQP